MKSISAIFGTSFKISTFFVCYISTTIYFTVKFFKFWDVFDVPCIIILRKWFAKFLLVMVSLNDMFKGKFVDG